ncbi:MULTISPECIES: response regulator [unclassified Minwuia]|jgi:two-component system, sensor histidine kinase and response regulator|uniref:sensor histidine kinase n=1 Tax=unclassified Minwuia TaxID=2618799 RepID=UPI002479860A|nr:MULTISPECIES: response regulator [unclassified Minwuia]
MDNEEKPRVLVVDDLEANRAMLARRLTRRGYDTVMAEDGPNALRLIDESEFDIILLDIMMPGMSGLEVLRLIRANRSPAILPVIMVTAIHEKDGIAEAIKLGANDYITKPVDLDITLARMQTQIDRRRAELSLHAANESLKRRVEERTRDLEKMNFDLRNEIKQRQSLEEGLRQEKKRAEAANRAKSEFLATMSHELRTPLNSIIGFSDLIRQQLESDATADTAKFGEYACYINESGQHLLRIVNDILDLTKVDAGKTILNESHTSVADLVDRSIRLVESLAQKHGIRIDFGGELENVELFCDEILMRRALLNMISNAVKFSNTGGHVEIRAEIDTNGDLHLIVADTGIGIKPEDIPRVMEAFGQADATHSRKHEGTGLGVPLTKSLVELHGGRFEMDSEPGVGTTVSLVLPGKRLEIISDEPVSANSAA